MHWFNVATVFFVVTLVGVEFSVSAFVNPAAWRLDEAAQAKMLGRFAFVLGRVMPVWYPACALMFVIQAWLHWNAPRVGVLLTAGAIWIITSVASIFFLVPLNSRIAEGAPDWQRIHRLWDQRHRVRIAALAVAALLLMDVLVC
jgi:uncharacterized membrane protein